MKDLNYRQKTILQILQSSQMGISEIEGSFEVLGIKASRATLKRDLVKLEKNKLIERFGNGKGLKYRLTKHYSLVYPLDVEVYFKQRDNRYIPFNSGVFNFLKETEIFTKSENKFLEELARRYKKQLRETDASILRREIERLTIDLSWKSSAIEGYTYDLLETETLIKDGILAKNKPKEDAMVVLNHKNAIKRIYESSKRYTNLDARDIISLHKVLVKDLGVKIGFRKSPVGVSGTTYEPPAQRREVQKAISEACKLINFTKSPFAKSLLTLSLISYIQPFADGNKRTSRILANAVLLAHDLFPLSFRNVNITEYKKAVTIFYEINNRYNLKKMFIEQCEFSVENYFHG